MFIDIKGFEGNYKINEDGEIYSLLSNKIIRPYITNKGYKAIDLIKEGDRHKYLVHRLVAETFVPNDNNYPIVLHKDNNKLNTNYTNLKWGTYSENNSQAIRDGLNKVPRPDNRKKYDLYNDEEVIIVNGLKDLISKNESSLSESAYRNFIFRNKPISDGLYKGYYIRNREYICPLEFY